MTAPAASSDFALSLRRLMNEAQQQTGLTDFGDLWFLEPLEVLLESLNREADLSSAGQAVTQQRLIGLLADRLKKVELFKQHPEIADEHVEVVAEILGLPRTGSTMLHRLLAASPQLTSTYSWEVSFPLPFPGEMRGQPTPRQIAAQQQSAALLQMSPEFAAIHDSSWDAYEEDVLLLDRAFLSAAFESMYKVPSYARWFLEYDQSRSYEELKDWLKILQWQEPTRRGRKWILKSPHHLTAVRTVLKTFDQCKIIMTHRAPSECVPSYASMVTVMTKWVTDKIDPIAIGHYWNVRFQRSLRALENARAEFPERFIDVRYADVQRDPMAEARRVLSELGMTIGPRDEAAMRQWLADNERGKHPAHRYTAEQFGLSAADMTRDYAFYIDKYL